MKPAPVWRAIDGLAQRVNPWGLQVGPDAALVKGNDGAYHTFLLGLRRIGAPPIPGGFRRGFLQFVSRLAGLRRLRVCLVVVARPLDVLEVCKVHTVEAQHLVELAVAARAAHVVWQRQGEAYAVLVRDVDVAHA